MPHIGFGLEKLGLLPLKAPRVFLAVIGLLTLIGLLGVPKLTSDAALSDLFRSSTPEYKDFRAMSDRFPTSEFDIFLVVEGKDLLEPKTLDVMRDLTLDIQFAQAVSGVISMFDMRGEPDKNGVSPQIIPTDLPTGQEFEALKKRIKSHPLIDGKLLSGTDETGQLSLIILSLDRKKIDEIGLNAAVKEIEAEVSKSLQSSELSFQLAGAPVMQLEVRNSIKRDRLIYNSAGFLMGFIICFVFFRRPKMAIIAQACPLVAVLWSLGLFGHLDLKLNTFLNVIPPLVMVIALSDAMHMVYSIRRRLARGESKETAIRYAVLNVGPACALTSLTTAVALLSLVVTDSAVIRMFGVCAAFAAIIGYLAVILVVPTLSYLWLEDAKDFQKKETQKASRLAKIEKMCEGIANWVLPRHIPIAITGLILVTAFTYQHLQLEPQYRLSDQLPNNKQAVAASERLDAKLTGAIPVHIMMQWPKDKAIEDREVQQVIAKAHSLFESYDDIGNVWSVETLRRWVNQNVGTDDPKRVIDYVNKMPKHLTVRFLNNKENAVLITGRLPNLDADETVPIVRKAQLDLADLKTAYPDYTFTVTGLVTLSALQSSNMIAQLNQGLMVAIVIVILLIGVAFRSIFAILLSIVPNLFPIVAAGSLLYISGMGLEYASVIGLTVAFGLAVDDTIHFLNRLYIERGRTNDNYEAVFQTVARIGPVLILTTIVLVLGLAVTIFSELPPMRLFGQLAMTTLTTALIADLLFLPAIILIALKLRNLKQSKHKEIETS
ncbi:MAG: MMPL family transporter [Pseudomonadota bacterium]